MMVQIYSVGCDFVQSNHFSATAHINQFTQYLIAHMGRYGYQPVDLPIIEPADLFLIKAGDQVIKKLFTFEQRGHLLALRPEFTAAAAYHYMLENGDSQPIARWQFSGFVFEDEPDDLGQNHQHFSVGAELIGMTHATADAEIISMASEGLQQSGIEWLLVLGHVGLLRHALMQFKLDSRTIHFLLTHLHTLQDPALGKPFVLGQLNKLSLGVASGSDVQEKLDTEVSLLMEMSTQEMLDNIFDTMQANSTMGGRTRHDITRRLIQKYRRASEHQQILNAIDFLLKWGQIAGPPEESFRAIEQLIMSQDGMTQDSLSDWKHTVELLETYGVPTDRIIIKPDLARSWDYYTGIIFELRTTDGIHLGGGGRYDELNKLLGNRRNVPAVGFAYYMDALVSSMPRPSSTGDKRVVIAVREATESTGIRWANKLRQQGLKVELMPEESLSASDIVLHAGRDDRLDLNGHSYLFEELEALLNDLKQITS